MRDEKKDVGGQRNLMVSTCVLPQYIYVSVREFT